MTFEEARMRKLQELEKVKPPYPHKYNITSYIEEITKQHELSKDYKTAGRVMAVRKMGKLLFADIWGNNKKLQISLDYQKSPEAFDFFANYVDSGDIVGVGGVTYETKRKEFTLGVNSLEVLSKSLSDIPRQWYGLKDVDQRYRQRYLDLIANKDSFELLKKRGEIVGSIRNYLNSENFTEVETPILQPAYGGANAKPFKTHINDIDQDWFLRISPELYLKRLVTGGFEKIYEIGKVFRNEGIDSRHNPEFTMMELYWAYADYNDVMKLTENTFNNVAKNVFGSQEVAGISYKTPWKKMTMKESIKGASDIDVDGLDDGSLENIVKKEGLEIPGGFNRGLAINKLFEHYVEPTLEGPIFITDHPKETTPLCKPHRKDNSLIERFELFIKGMEIANAYTELNDPRLQKKFFDYQSHRKVLGDEEAHATDNDYLNALSYGLPPTGGLGIGIDRMAMVMTGSETIKDLIMFPIVKRTNGI